MHSSSCQQIQDFNLLNINTLGNNRMHSVVKILNKNIDVFKSAREDQRQTNQQNNQCAQIMLKILLSFYAVDYHRPNQQVPNIAQFLLKNQSAKTIFGEKRLQLFSKSNIHIQLSKSQFSQVIQQIYKSFKPTDSLKDRYRLTQQLNLPYEVCILVEQILLLYQTYTDALSEVINGIFLHFLAWNFVIFIKILNSPEKFSYDYLEKVFQGDQSLEENPSKKIKFNLFYKSFKSPQLFARFLNDAFSQEKHNVLEIIKKHNLLSNFHL